MRFTILNVDVIRNRLFYRQESRYASGRPDMGHAHENLRNLRFLKPDRTIASLVPPGCYYKGETKLTTLLGVEKVYAGAGRTEKGGLIE